MAEASRRGNRKMGWIGWSVVALVIMLLAIFALWRWALSSQTVALLDWADSLFTASETSTSDRIAFGVAPGQSLVVVRPVEKPSTAVPVVIFIHGGSWAKGDPAEYAFAARNLAIGGFVAVSAGYRLVPGGEYPAMLEDGAAATRWVVDNIADFGGDPSRIYLMGHSAGAYNAVMLALDPQWFERAGVDRTRIKGAIGLAGPYDFLPLDGEGTRNAFGKAEDLQATQPINFARKDAPPLLLLTGTADTTVRPRNSTALAQATATAGQPSEVRQFPGMSHAGIVMALARPFEGDGAVKRTIFEFLAETERAAPQSSGDIQPAAR